MKYIKFIVIVYRNAYRNGIVDCITIIKKRELKSVLPNTYNINMKNKFNNQTYVFFTNICISYCQHTLTNKIINLKQYKILVGRWRMLYRRRALETCS